jgi:hypothetical protein
MDLVICSEKVCNVGHKYRNECFFSSPRPYRLWGPPSLLSLGVISLRAKWPGSEADYSPPYSAEVKNALRYTSTPPVHLHCVVLILKKSPETTSPFTFNIMCGISKCNHYTSFYINGKY